MEPRKVKIIPPARLPSAPARMELRPNKANYHWVMKTLLLRLKEASSWAGVAVIGGLFGMSAEESSILWQVVTAVSAAVAIFLPEKAENKADADG